MTNTRVQFSLDLQGAAAIVCHDAGATNLIIDWLKADGRTVIKPFMQGPAEKLWCAAFPTQALCNSLEEALDGVQTLISGTGWESALEHRARQVANKRYVHNIAVLDHWVNYAERFEREGVIQWPDEVWVGDIYAKQLVQRDLPRSISIRQLDNIYLRNQVEKVNPAPGTGTILVLLEPVRGRWGEGCLGEFQALDYLLGCINTLFPFSVRQLLLRQHPSEPDGKYQEWLDRHPMASLDSSRDVADAISKADAVVGIESFALVIALESGRPVYSCLPPYAPELRLPHAGIKQLRLMARSS